MTDLGFDKLPTIVQYGLNIGWVFAGVVAWVLGRRYRAATPEDVTSRELDQLRHNASMVQLQRELEQKVQTIRESLQINISEFKAVVRQELRELDDENRSERSELDDRLRAVEIELARIQGRPTRINPPGRRS